MLSQPVHVLMIMHYIYCTPDSSRSWDSDEALIIQYYTILTAGCRKSPHGLHLWMSKGIPGHISGFIRFAIKEGSTQLATSKKSAAINQSINIQQSIY